MAGRPKRQAIRTALERRAREELEQGASALDYVCAWVESGKTLLDLTDELAEEIMLPIGRMAVTSFLRETYDDYEPRMAEARRRSAHGLVDEAMAIVDDAATPGSAVTREDLQHAKQRADVRLWMAERFNREELGGSKGTQVTINIPALHLDAMRLRAIEGPGRAGPVGVTSSVSNGHTAALPPDAPDAPDAIDDAIPVDYEVVSDDETTS